MAVDSLFHKVLALIQGGSRANVAPALPVPTPPPLNPVYNAVITFSSNVTDGADHINLSDGVLTITPHAASMRKTVLEVGLHTAIERNLTVEAVFELNLDVVAGAPIANILNTLEIRYAGSGLIDIHYHSTRRDLQYMSSYPYTPAKVTRYVGGGKLYLYARSKVRMDLYTSPPGGYGGSSTSYESQPVEFEIRSESGTVTTIPTAYPFTSDIGSNSFSGASSTNNWNAAPANELSVTTSYVRMGYLPKAANYPTTWRATSRDLVVYGDGGIGMTAVEKTDTGEVIRVLNSTTPVNGMTAYQALTVCAQAIAAQVPETPNILPGKVTTHDQPIYEVQNGMAVVIGYDRTVILSLPHSQVDSVWTLTVACDSTFQSRFQDAGMSSGVFCYGDGLPAIMNVTLSHTGALGVFGVAILDSNYGYWTVPVDQIPDIPPEQIAVYTVSDIDDAFGYIRDRLAQKGTITTAATNATTRVFTLTTSQYLDRYGGPLRHLKFFARKNLIAEGGISKLYGVRFTADERPKESSFPTLPWPMSSIPGGGPITDANTKLLMHFDETSGTTLADETGRTFTTTDIATHTTASGKFSRGVFPASNTWDGAVGSSPVNISGGVFTIEFFVARRGSGATTAYETVFAQTTNSGTWADGLVVFVSGDNNLVQAYIDGVPTPGAIIGNTPGVWQHIALVRSGNGGTGTKWYVNGVGESGFATGYATHANVNPHIGNTAPSAGYQLNSVGIDELRISDMARYTADFAPPTAPFEIGSGTGWGTLPADVIFAVNAESNGNDVAQFGLSATASGTATIQASGSRTGDGYLRNTDSAQMADACFGYTPNAGFKAAWGAAQSMTLEFDIKYETGGHLGGQILGIGPGYTSLTSGGTTGANINGSPFATSAGTAELTIGAWHHIAFVADYNAGDRLIRTYRDGVQQDTPQSVLAFNFNDYPNPTTIGLLQLYAGFIGNGALKGGMDNIVLTTRAKYTANFTPGASFPEIVGYTPPPSNIDVTCAGYNDIAFVSCEGSLTIQTSQPVAYFDSSTTVGDVTPTGAVFVVDSVSADFSGSSTLAAFTCSGSFVRSIPVEFDGAATLDDVTNDTGGFYSDVPKEMTGDSVLDDVECIAVLLFLAPMSFDANVLCDDVVSDGLMSLIEPVVYRLNSTVPAATIAANTTQFYVDATVPAATLSAEISQYEGFKLDVTVPAATGQAWFGMRLNSDVPRVALHAIGLVPNTLRLNATLPRVLLDAGALGGRVLRLTATVPAPSLSAWTGWRLMATTPAASSSGSIITGGAFRLTELVPAAVLSASSTQLNVLALNAVVPAAIRSGWLAITRTVPAARVTAHIAPVVAATRLAYSFTLSNSAMTRYPAYPFIQVLRMGNAYYGVGEDGLYELGGANDNGVAIPWSWETCMSDFGKAEKKTVVSAYLGGYVPQSMTYTIKVGDAPTGTNAHTTTATAVLRNHRQKFGIGRKSRFFAFGLSATQGQVAIESVEFEMASMSRRV